MRCRCSAGTVHEVQLVIEVRGFQVPEGGRILLGDAPVIRDKFGRAGWHILSVLWDSESQTGSGGI